MRLNRIGRMMLAAALVVGMMLSSGCLVFTFGPRTMPPATSYSSTTTYQAEPLSFDKVSQTTLKVLRDRNMATDVEPPDRTPPGEMIIHTRDAQGGDVRINVRSTRSGTAEIKFNVESAEGRELARSLLDQIRREEGL